MTGQIAQRQIARLWSDLVMVSHPEEAVLRTAAEWLRSHPDQIAADYCVLVGRAIGLPRKMSGEHLLRLCTSVWAEQLDLEPSAPLLELLSEKAEEAPYRDHFGLWDGLWLPLAIDSGELALVVQRQHSTRAARTRSDLERLLAVEPGATDDDLQAAVEALLQRQQLEQRALAIGLSTEVSEEDVLEREEELRLPGIRAVNGRFPEAALEEYLRVRMKLKELRGYTLPMKSTAFLPAKCAKCHLTIRDYATPCQKDGGVCDDVEPGYYERRPENPERTCVLV